MTQRTKNRWLGAFTLLELLVSSAILGLVMFIMLAAVDTGMRLWKTAEDKIQVDREARTALSQITQDLQNIINPPTPAPQPIFQDPDADGKFMEFLVLKPQDYQNQTDTAANNVGDVCYVRYRLENNKIYRAFADSGPTFEALQSNRFPSGEDVVEEILAINVRTVEVVTQGIYGEYQQSFSPQTRSLFCYIQTNEPSSFSPNAPPPRRVQHFTATASIPAQ